MHIPIINYHKIEPDWDIGITTRHPDRFYRDMEYLSLNKFNTITFKDLVINKSLPENPLIITFDDGYESVFNFARPVLKEFGFRAVAYIPVHYIGKINDWDVQFGSKRYRHLSAEQIQIMSAEGFEIASHGLDHLPFTMFDSVRLSKELSQSKSMLEQVIKTEVVSICYPFGHFNHAVIQAVRESGYSYGVASLYFKDLHADYSQFVLPRFNIYRFDSLKSFSRKLSTNFHSVIGYRDWLFQLGGRATPIYQKIKKRISR